MELKPISQQVVVVMGASSGIGRVTALRFAELGAKVVAAARSEEGLRTLVDEIRRNGGAAEYKVADVADFQQVQAVADHAAHTFGRVDTWVGMAGVSLYATVEQTTPEEFEQVLKVNLQGQFHSAKAALPYLKRQGGALILISSVEGMRAFPFQAAYAASKHGVIALADALRSELEHAGIPVAVTTIMPPGVNTPFFNKARTKLGVKPMPAPPIYQPDVIADAILRAAEHPTRDIAVTAMGKLLAGSQRLSPELTDVLIQGMGFSGQKTDEPKSPAAPDNMYGPISGYNKIEGDFSSQSIGRGRYTGRENEPDGPGLGVVLIGAALGGALFLASRRNERERLEGPSTTRES
ncbi:MAG: SDR family oxidoreductase [Roseiflexaceae bacterium]|nr:SDR family oxidoreductase [Roseiflexaceae bacterium]